MCGISGVAGNFLGKEDVEILRDLTMFSAARGMDSTGIMTARDRRYNNQKESEISVIKSTYTPNEFLQDDDIKKMLNPSDLKAAVIHTRSATKGKISTDNSHPFRFEHVVGVHNGTIHTTFPGHSKFETDSEGLYNLINEVGIHKAVEEVGNYGAYALVWFDERNKTLNFLRNDQRPLFFCYDNHHRTLYFSSEYLFLLTALRRRGKAYKEDLGIQSFKPDTLSCFEWNRHDGLKFWKNEEVKPRPLVHRTTHTGGGVDRSKFKWDNKLGGWRLKDDNPWEEIDDRDFFSKPPANVNESVTDCKVPEKKEVVEGDTGKKSPPINLKTEQEQARQIPTKPRKAQRQTGQKERTQREERILEFHKRNNPSLVGSEETRTAFQESLTDSGITYKTSPKHYYTATEMEHLLNQGCNLCKETFSLELNSKHFKADPKDMTWVKPDVFVCDSCNSQDWVKDYLQQIQSEETKAEV